MNKESPKYHSFLLRLWALRQKGILVWRASLENPQTEEILGFESPENLFDYLRNLTRREDNDER